MAAANEKAQRTEPAALTRVALIQMQCGPEPQANLEKAIARVREAAAEGGQIICLPELFVRNISARRRTTPTSSWPRKSPGLPPRP